MPIIPLLNLYHRQLHKHWLRLQTNLLLAGVCLAVVQVAAVLFCTNLQKALLARELAFDPLVLVVAQPTRGLDVAAREFVHRQFLDLRARGRAVVAISEDLEELFEISDRIAVIYEGRVLEVLNTAETSVAQVGLLMAGGEAA